MKADLHIHTNYSSCAKQSVEDVLKTARKRGLDVIAITDHNTIKGAIEAKKKNKYKKLKVIVGCEQKCEYGELLIYNLKKEIKSHKFKEIVKEARKQKAYIFIAHPIDYIRFNNMWKRLDKKTLSLVDGIEVKNGRNLFNSNVAKLKEKMGLKGVAGSDAHFSEEIGNTYVEFKKNLWKEIMEGEVRFYHDHSTINKITHLIKSFLRKRIRI